MEPKVIGFFKTEKLAKNKIEVLLSSKLDSDNSTYSIEKTIDNIFVVYGEINFSQELKNEIEALKEISNGIHTITEFEKITTNIL